jgi:plastocyanin
MGPRLRARSLLSAMACNAPASAADTIRVTIDKLNFAPAQVSAHVGDTIEWVSSDFIAHTATARNKDWDVAIPPKGIGSVVLQHAGDVDYFCRFHPNMTGRISVMPER